MQKKPEIIVFAGPNGSGKSTITKLAKRIEQKYVMFVIFMIIAWIKLLEYLRKEKQNVLLVK